MRFGLFASAQANDTELGSETGRGFRDYLDYKVFPTLHNCAELGRVRVHAGRMAFPDIPRF